MAAYNNLEKDIIRYLIDNKDNMIYYLYLMKSILQENECIRVNFCEERVDLFLNMNENELMRIPSNNTLNKSIDNLLKRIIIFTSLLESLRKDHYIVLFEAANECETSLSFGCSQNNIPYSIADSQIKELILKYAASQVVVSEDLVALANRNFKTQEQCNIEKTQKISIFGIITAFLTGIGGIFSDAIVSLVKSLFKS